MAEGIPGILITGLPGTGKTTILKKLASKLDSDSTKYTGFYTEERREGKTRIGFDVCSFSNDKNAALARISTENNSNRHRVGKYSVFVDNFESIALPELENVSTKLLLIDEIGKMELLSKKFEARLKDIVKEMSTSNLRLIATVPCNPTRPIQIVEEFKSLPNMRIFEITKQNRNAAFEEILKCLIVMNKEYKN